jgi:hypothetical protein
MPLPTTADSVRHLPWDFLALASAVRANGVTVNVDLVVPRKAKGLTAALRISAVAGTPTVDLRAQHRDPVSGVFADVPGASVVQQVGTGTVFLTVRPSVTAVANSVVPQPIGANVRLVLVIGNAPGDSATCSVGGTWLP